MDGPRVNASAPRSGHGDQPSTWGADRHVTTDRLRSNFISMISHELRTPLNSINGFLEIVAEEQVGPLNDRQREFLNYARQSTQQLTLLVEDILFITKADSGEFRLRWTWVDAEAVVAQVIMAHEASAAKAQVRLVCDAPSDLPALYADELRVQQVLGNLLSNAIKFSPPGGAVRVSVRVEGDNLCFAVADSGAGVPDDERARIFERFYQSEGALRTRSGGYGLGLAIAKLIVEQHGGRIAVENVPGAGARFAFRLPVRGASET